MKFTPHLAIVATLSFAACSKAPDTSAANQRMEERLQKIEAQLSRIENAIAATPSNANTAVTDQITIYVSGPVANPGKFSVSKNISLLAALAVAGGPKDTADLKKIKITRTGQKDQVVTDKNAFKDILLADGDVVVVPQSFW